MSFLTGWCKDTTVGLPEKQRIEKVFFETMPSDKACEAFTGFFWLMMDWLMDIGRMFDRVCISTICRGLSFWRVSCNTGFQTSTVLPPVKVVQLAWKGKVSPRIWLQKSIPVVLVFRVLFDVHLKPCLDVQCHLEVNPYLGPPKWFMETTDRWRLWKWSGWCNLPYWVSSVARSGTNWN